jgi:DNA-binding NtrC family response regulator
MKESLALAALVEEQERQLMKRYHVLLGTEDATLETTVKALAANAGCELECARTRRDALCLVVQDTANHAPKCELVVVDLDWREGGHTLLTDVRGVLPVIAISSKPKHWLSSMLRRHRIGAMLAKPVSPEALREAFLRVGNIPCDPETRGGWWRLAPVLQHWGENLLQAASGARQRGV